MSALRHPPRATVRLQLHRGFGFADAAAQVGYHRRLGVSHYYLSPILAARQGSTHGYDVVDPTRVNPELGGEDGLRALVAELRRHGMGVIVDIVPNHMAVGGDDNAWWLDVLKRGRRSAYARFFDIDWDVPDPALRGKVLAPFLGAPYGEVLNGGDLKLVDDGGEPCLRYFEHRFPLTDPAAARPLLGRTPSPAELHQLLERQHYRLAWWRTAPDEINWRRFFDITSLAGLRVEDGAVFDAVHAKTFELYAAGLVDGLRIDHVDGLADPGAYCQTLRRRLGRLARQRPATPWPEPYLVVEKILAPGEKLREDWGVHGTTGYSFMTEAGAVLTDPAGEAPLTELWEGLSGRTGDFAAEQLRARRRVLDELLDADFGATALALHRIARADVATRCVSLHAIRRVLAQVLAHFPVYRTYTGLRGRSPEDAAVMAQACEAARAACRPAERPLVDLVDRWLGAEPPAALPDAASRRLRLRAIGRFQQLSSPLAAKAVEDTAFYRHGRLLARNEVGGDPAQFAMPVADFHAACIRRQQAFPHALLATATHDHKRGEDLRARLLVLSERPVDWAAAVSQWRELNAPLRADAAIGAGDEYMLYQTLAGAWAPDLRPGDAAALAAFGERLAGWQLKALREAKLQTGWIEPDADYEASCRRFLERCLDPSCSGEFLADLARFVDSIAPAGALNSLTQALLRLTAPGVPDQYQGTEFWDFSLVDPDNRRPVDYAARAQALDGDAAVPELLASWRDGRIKQRLVARVLALRAEMPQLFAAGVHEPLEVRGERAASVIAYARRTGSTAGIVIAPRTVAAGVEAGLPRVSPAWWGATTLVLPRALRGPARDAITGRERMLGEFVVLETLLGEASHAVLLKR